MELEVEECRADALGEGENEGGGPRVAVPVPPPTSPPPAPAAVPLGVVVRREVEVGVPPLVTEGREVRDEAEEEDMEMAGVRVELPPVEGDSMEEELELEVGIEEKDLKGVEEDVSLALLLAEWVGVEVRVPPLTPLPVGEKVE